MDVFHSMRVFIRVAEAGSFTAAAQALDLSTAQVSRLVSDLENLLQARLLQRSTRRLALSANSCIQQTVPTDSLATASLQQARG